jgi:predicted HTH domain antitoxin
VQVPSDLMTALRRRQSAQTDEELLLTALAVGLFAAGAISLAKAAELAGRSRYEFAQYLHSLGFAAYEYDLNDLRSDVAGMSRA